jgi:mRNA interferase HigB
MGGKVRQEQNRTNVEGLLRLLRPKWAHDTLRPCGSLRRTLKRFVETRAGHRDQSALKAALDAWFGEIRKAAWSNAADVKRHHATASVISADRVVFNIKGNSYRLVVAVDFEKAIVFIKWIGTHAEYDKIDVRTVQHGD